MKRRHSLFGFLFGMAFQFAFAEGVLLIIRHFLAEDPEALAKYPYVRIALYIFWTPFIIKNALDYIRDWKAEAAVRRLEKMADKDRNAAERAAAKAAREAGRKKAREQAELERQRAQYQKQIDDKARKDVKEQREQAARESKICPNCGARIVARANFCPQCRAKQ